MSSPAESSVARVPAAAPLAAVPLWLCEALLVVCWSAGFVGARFAIDHAPGTQALFWRFLVVSLALAPLVWRAMRAAPWRVIARHAGFGVLAIGGYLGGVMGGIERGVPAGVAALIADLLPLGTAGLAWLLGHGVARAAWAGIAIGLAGVLVAGQGALVLSPFPLYAALLPLAGMLALAVATLWRDRRPPARDLPLAASLWVQCTAAAVMFGAASAAAGHVAPPLSWPFAGAVMWMAVLPTLGGYGLYWVCLARSSPLRVTAVLYLSPVVTLIWAWAVFGEPLSATILAGSALCLAGVVLVARHDGRPAPR